MGRNVVKVISIVLKEVMVLITIMWKWCR